MTKERKIEILKQHAINLDNAKTFEEYKSLHVLYIECLIAEIEGGEWVWKVCSK